MWLTISSAAIRLVPGDRATRLLGELAHDGGSPGSAQDVLEARRIGRAVTRAAVMLPWRPLCLPQAMAAQRMLRWRGIRPCLHLGIVTTTPLCTHAWLTVEGAVVQGAPVPATTVATFR